MQLEKLASGILGSPNSVEQLMASTDRRAFRFAFMISSELIKVHAQATSRGEIDIQALREFQSSHRSPSKPSKPVPDGFNTDMANDRKALPKGEA